jgi:hypothetical protein
MPVERTVSADELRRGGIDPDYLAHILPYLSAAIDVRAGAGALHIRFDGDGGALDALLTEARRRIGHALLARTPEPLFARSCGTEARGPWPALLERGEVFDLGGGRVGYRGLPLEVVERLDRHLVRAALAWGAEAAHFPHLLAADDLRRLGLLDQHPHQLWFAAPLDAGFANIEGAREGAVGRERLAEPLHGLKTSACWPVYLALAGQRLPAERLLTVRGECARYEARRTQGLARLTEFSMREVVFLGEWEGAERFRQRALDLLRTLAERLDLTMAAVPARDLFFLSTYGTYAIAQTLSGDKIEARAPVAGDEEVAVASFNHHRAYFTRRMDLSLEGAAAVTACVGFGLERLACAVLARHGAEEGPVRAALDRLDGAP